MQIFVDMDGVLANFDDHHESIFGIRPDRVADNVDWLKVRAHSGFFAGIPPMSDANKLWSYVKPHNPIVLTGVPPKVKEAADNKVGWIRRHIDADAKVICCRSSEKSLHMQPGDILIDDWEKYRHLWIARGGRWITHTSAETTISQLRSWGI